MLSLDAHSTNFSSLLVVSKTVKFVQCLELLQHQNHITEDVFCGDYYVVVAEQSSKLQ